MKSGLQSVAQVISEMETILSNYLTAQEIEQLTTPWRQHNQVSLQMVQQCLLDTFTQYPKLRAHKAVIRKQFWAASMETDVLLNPKKDDASAERDAGTAVSGLVKAFHAVMLSLGNKLKAHDRQQLFTSMHQMVAEERTLKAHYVNMEAYLQDDCPAVPDNAHVLNNIVQLAYVCLCDIEGPVEADNIFYNVHETAKAQHDNDVVAQLF